MYYGTDGIVFTKTPLLIIISGVVKLDEIQ